jgi:antitoxin component of RelBE/YafQ-DinJ toxin-antitoxin module
MFKQACERFGLDYAAAIRKALARLAAERAWLLERAA